MPDTELHLRVVTLEEAFDDVGRRPRPFIIVNSECHPDGIPTPNRLLLEHLRQDCDGDLLIVPTTLTNLDAHLPLCRDRDRFIAGEPVVMAVTKVHETPERGVGGQDVLRLEERARGGLYVTVAIATERLRACADFSEHRKMGTEARRGEILERLNPILAELSARNCFAEGQKLITKWYPGATARLTMNSAYDSVLNALRNDADRVAVDAGQIELVRTARVVYGKTEAILRAQHAMSSELSKLTASDKFKQATPEMQHEMQANFLRERATAQHQELAHNKHGGPSMLLLMRAATAMDLNPSSIYANVLFYKTELDCAMFLGRVERGFGAMFGPKHIARLKRVMAQADAVENKDAVVDSVIEAARYLRDLALRVKSHAGWEEFFAIAKADGGALWVDKSF